MARASRKAAEESPYGVHPGVAKMQKWVADLKEKTGKTIEEWAKVIKKDGPATTKERRDWLKQEYQVGTNTAWQLADYAEGKKWLEETPEAYLKAATTYVEAMFAGPKAGLRPIFEELMRVGKALGADVKVCPCETIVPFYRQHVFAQVKPTTRTRIDFGFALGDTKATGKLIDTGGFAKKDRITHRIPISSLADIDAEVKNWLKVAYGRDDREKGSPE
jgi:hypothetical protein